MTISRIGVTLYLVLAGVIAYFAIERLALCQQRWELKQRPQRALSDKVDGPGVFRGKLMAPAGRVAPSGRPAAVYSLALYRKEEDASDPVCRLAELSRIWLADAHTQLAIDIPPQQGPDPAVRRRFRLGLEPTSAGLQLAPPSAVLAQCGITNCVDSRAIPAGSLAAPRFAPSCEDVYALREVVISPGTPVTVVGCRAGDLVKDCLDGQDFLSSRDFAALGDYSVGQGVLQLFLTLLLVLLTWAILTPVPLLRIEALLRSLKQKESP